MVRIQNLTHRFGQHTVLKDISLDVDAGESVAIMGSSGGGKTTLLRCISGLIVPTEGTVTVDGIDVREHPEEARRRMGMVFQSAALFDYMTVEENVLFGIQRTKKMAPKERAKVAGIALEKVGLRGSEGKMPSELSGGMRKRVGMARAIALEPRLMLYDEPTTGLDPITTYTIDALIVSLKASLGVTSLIVSHDLKSVLRTSDRVTFLHKGEMVFNGTGAEFQSSSNKAIRELVEKSQASVLSAAE